MRQHGYTLLELLVALAIVALVATAAPLIGSEVMPRLQLERDLEAVRKELSDARFESLRSGKTISVSLSKLEAVPEDSVLVAAAHDRIHFFPNGTSSGAVLVLVGRAGEFDLRVAEHSGVVSVLGVPSDRGQKQ